MDTANTGGGTAAAAAAFTKTCQRTTSGFGAGSAILQMSLGSRQGRPYTTITTPLFQLTYSTFAAVIESLMSCLPCNPPCNHSQVIP